MSFPPTEVGTPLDISVEVCSNSKYLVYCNAVLPESERLRY